MRLIDAERVTEMLKKAAVHMLNGFPDGYDTGVSKGLIDAADIVNHAPAVDAVEVVRCKDCKKWDDDADSYGKSDGVKGKCMKSFETTREDDFCSYGEARSGIQPQREDV